MTKRDNLRVVLNEQKKQNEELVAFKKSHEKTGEEDEEMISEEVVKQLEEILSDQ